jgi:3-hydroxyisobutyrate dehydrogenase
LDDLFGGMEIAGHQEDLPDEPACRPRLELLEGPAGCHRIVPVSAAYRDTRRNPAIGALDIFVRDMGLVLDAARDMAYPAPLASAAAQLYLAGRRAGLGRRDDSSLTEVLRGNLTASGPGRPG